MDVVDEKSYQEVINQLSAYTSKAFEHCANMRSAASTCVSTMGDDPAAARSSTALNKCLSQIQEGVDSLQKIKAAMNKELEDSISAQRKAQFD